MKFTKEQAYEELVRLMTSKGEKLNLSSRTMNADLETLIPVLANEETEMNDFVAKVLPIFQSADANVRNDVSVGIKAYKEQNPPTPPTPPTNPNQPQETELEQRLKALEEAYQKETRKNFERASKDSLKAAIKAKGVKNDTWIDAMLSKAVFADDFDVTKEADSYVEMFNTMMASYTPSGVTPGSSNGGTDTHISDAIKAASELAKSQNLQA